MKLVILKALLLLSICGSFVSARADIVLPLDGMRSQGKTGHCWAYSMGHVLSARMQFKNSVVAPLDIERDLYYWVYYERFMERYKKGSELEEFTDIDILDDGGFPAEFWSKFLAHGHSIYSTEQALLSPTVSYPNLPQTRYPYIAAQKNPGSAINAKKLLLSLSQAVNENEASRLILAELDRSFHSLTTTHTNWFGKTIPLSQTPRVLLGNDYPKLSNDELIWIFKTKDTTLLHKLETYYDGKYKSSYETSSELEILAKKSLDLGLPFPITITRQGYDEHVMTAIGYNGSWFLIADSLNPHYYWVNFSEVESVMIFGSLTSIWDPQVHLSRTTNPRIRKLR